MEHVLGQGVGPSSRVDCSAGPNKARGLPRGSIPRTRDGTTTTVDSNFPVSYEHHTLGEVAFPLFMDGDLAKLYLAH